MKTQNRLLRFSTARLALAAALASLNLMAIDPDLPYSSPSTGLDGALSFNAIPVAGRQASGMVYDAERKQIVMFGGYTPSSVADTWVLDSDSSSWRNVSPPTGPVPRYGHAMAYDPVRKVVLLFGGYGAPSYGDTWTWDGTAWTQLNPATAPSARYYSSMAFDQVRGEMVLYGGNASSPGGSETWTWNGTTWTQKSPAASPGNQNGHGMAYDPVRQRVVMFTPNRQTWTWDGANWANVSPVIQPLNRDNFEMDWDAARQRIVLFGGSGSGSNETWLWDGSAWTLTAPANSPGTRHHHGVAYDSERQKVVVYGGVVSGVDTYSSDTWLWDGVNWTKQSDKIQFFDASEDTDGIFNFSTIDVPPGVTVQVIKNSANSPIRWLATGDVTIRGTIDVNGEYGGTSLPPGVVARGGPGGFDGGRGGVRYDQSGSFAGTPGQGPGGGRAGANMSEAGNDGDYSGSNGYGNPYIQPLIGGSGGGGGAANNTVNGGNGGGGGGAILIDSSRDIVLSGAIVAMGGNVQHSGTSWGGRGSGGAILLRADRISGNGLLEATGGVRNNANGRIRLEAFFRSFTGQTFPVPITSDPVQGPPLTQLPVLTITQVAAQNVPQPPSGNQLSPDVVFNMTSQVNIQVTAQNVPDGTPVRLRLTTRDGVVTAGPSFLTGGAAAFNLVIPSGVGSIQAFADFRTGN